MAKIKFNLILPRPVKQKQRNNAVAIIEKVDGMVEEDSSTGVCKIRIGDGRLFDIHPEVLLLVITTILFIRLQNVIILTTKDNVLKLV